MRMRMAGLSTAFWLAACGGDGLGSGDDPGTGTGTLLVNGEVVAVPVVPNAASADDFNTALRVDVTKGGVPVTIDSIVITSDAGPVTLQRDGVLGVRWSGAQSGYHRSYQLTIEAGADVVRDVRVEGPPLHHFTAPAAGATVDATMPLLVTWERAAAAAVATIDTRALDAIAIGDTGRYTIPVGGLRSKETELESEQLSVHRWNQISPAGAFVGSTFVVAVRNELDVVVAATGPR